jgi:predicted AAA+ superfamily ATPase
LRCNHNKGKILFDVGLANYLCKRTPAPQTPEYGQIFEQFILMELFAYKAYRDPEMEVSFWRTYTKQEVDFVINNLELAIEIKSGKLVNRSDLKHLTALYEGKKVPLRLIVCQEKLPKVLSDRYGDILVLPWQEFCRRLWQNGISKIAQSVET